MKRILSTALLSLCLVVPSAGAAASRSAAPARGGQMLSVWAAFDPGPVDGLGLGARLAFPIVPQGLLHAQVRDDIALELGADFVHYRDTIGYYPYGYFDYSWSGVLPVVGVMWDFWLTPQFAVYPKVDFGYWFGWYSGWDPYYGYAHPNYGGAFAEVALGATYRTRSGLALRAEAGSGLLRLGVGFAF